VMGGVYAEGGGMEARRKVGDGVDVYAQGAVSEFDGAGGVFEGGAQVHAGGFKEGGAVAKPAEGVVVAGAEDDLHAGAHEAGGGLGEERGGRPAVMDAMEITRTSEFSQRQVHTLSGGERQRVRMAMALAQEPQLLLLDEPGTYLDIRHQLEIMDLLVKLKRERQMTIVIVLHDINQAALYADYTIAMKAGRIQAYGKTDEVITRQLVEQVFDLNVNEFVSSDGETVLMPSGNK